MMLALSDQLRDVVENVKTCSSCGNVDTISPCSICQDEERDQNLICVIETISDLWALERSGSFKGRYHVLGGNLSIMNGRMPETLNLNSIKDRVMNQGIKEVIIATSSTLEGQTTAHYIADLLSGLDIKISKLAHGIPIGADIDYMDDGTLNLALKMRHTF
jgi:recombination protein RecR